LPKGFERFDPATLGQNEAFISAVPDGSQAAVRTHYRDKLEALRNAVLNVAIGRTPDEDEQAVFFGYVVNFNRVASEGSFVLSKPDAIRYPQRFRRHCGKSFDCLGEALPALQGRRDFYDQIVKDLYQRGLLMIESLHLTMTPSGAYAERTSDQADRFLAFINAPT